LEDILDPAKDVYGVCAAVEDCHLSIEFLRFEKQSLPSGPLSLPDVGPEEIVALDPIEGGRADHAN
jgi:hypothetical protein